MDSQHPFGVAHGCLHGSVVPPSRGFRLDIAQPAQGRCLRCLRHRSQTDGHPLRRGLVHQLHGPRGEVHRLHHEALPSCLDLLRLPLQRHVSRRQLSLLGPHLQLTPRGSGFWQNDSRVGSPCKWSLPSAIEVCSSATVTESSGIISDTYDNSYCVRTYPGL